MEPEQQRSDPHDRARTVLGPYPEQRKQHVPPARPEIGERLNAAINAITTTEGLQSGGVQVLRERAQERVSALGVDGSIESRGHGNNSSSSARAAS